ncbi:Uncharacterised protein [uncultured archaeon]|nr:Uncharacterised protein [uncultured archaeon]
MKIHEVIQEFIPCEVCGNSDAKNFYFHVFVHKGSQPFVKCGECEEEYYSTKAREIITRVEDSRKNKKKVSLKKEEVVLVRDREKTLHPLVRVLSEF